MHQRLRKKGWSDKELKRLRSAKKNAKRTGYVRFLDDYLFWIVVIAAIIGNFVIAITLIPVFLVFFGVRVYLVVILLALAFGLLYEHILSDFEDWSHHHYVLTIGIVPGVAAMNVIVMTEFSNFLLRFLGITAAQHPSLIIGLVYGLVFLLPMAMKHVHLGSPR